MKWRHVWITTVIVVALFLFLAFIITPYSSAHYAPQIKTHNIRHAINLYWCGNSNRFCYTGYQAFEVAGCETGDTYNIWASNGQYKGLFQMGESERERYGHGWNPWAQSKAAHKYYLVAEDYWGWGWTPWECQP